MEDRYTFLFCIKWASLILSFLPPSLFLSFPAFSSLPSPPPPPPPPPPLFLSSLFHIASYWDDWMREPQQRKGRVCIRPEISRTYTFGDAGVSLGQYWSQHLQYIVLNQNPVDFSKVNISYLQQVSCSEGFLVMI